MGGLATRQFRVAIRQGQWGIRQDLGILVVERGTFHLNSGRRMAATAHSRTSGCYAGSASIAEKEAGASEEQGADDAADDDAGNGAAGEPFAGWWRGDEDGGCWVDVCVAEDEDEV
jgi:hypothetical protein